MQQTIQTHFSVESKIKFHVGMNLDEAACGEVKKPRPSHVEKNNVISQVSFQATSGLGT